MAAPVYDTSNRVAFASTTSQTLSHTCTGSNLILYANVGIVGTTDLVTGVTYNGVAMTRLQTDFFATVGVRVYQYYLLAPSTGANNIIATLSSAQQVAIESISYTGAKQSAPVTFAAQQTAAATTWSQSITTVDDNSLVMAYLGDSLGRTPTAGANTTVRQTGAGQGDHTLDSTLAKTPAGSTSLAISGWSTSSSTAVNSLMVVIPPVASATIVHSLMSMGMGA